jgi:hypothetical protein
MKLEHSVFLAHIFWTTGSFRQYQAASRNRFPFSASTESVMQKVARKLETEEPYRLSREEVGL